MTLSMSGSGGVAYTYVYVPPALQGTGLDTAVQNAIASLNTALNNYGVLVNYARTTTECAGGHCVKMEVATPGDPNACAEIVTPYTSDSGGQPTSAMTLRIRPDWNSSPAWDNTFLDRTYAHELSHALGLKENECGSSDSIMGIFSSCGQSMSTTTATATDAIPVAQTVYGGGTRNVCQ
jgi:hypothetical protein